MNITFNGNDLSQHIKVLDAERSLLPSIENTVTKVTARNGGFFDWDRLDSRIITVKYVIETEGTAALQKSKRKLAGLLKTSEPQKLIFSDEPDLYYMAKLDSDTPITQTLGVAEGVLTFICIDPLAYSIFLETVSTNPKPDYTEQPTKYKKGDTWLVSEDVPVVIKSDFAGKEAGSEVECPHELKWTYASTLLLPTQSWNNAIQSYIDNVKELDGKTFDLNRNTNNLIAQILLSYNILSVVQRAYPFLFDGLGESEQVEKLKEVVNSLIGNAHATGSGPKGNKVYFASWEVNKWIDTKTSSANSITKLSITNSNYIIDDKGFAHYLLYADPSDGTTPSSVSLDYTNVETSLLLPLKGKLMIATKDSDSFDMADWEEFKPESALSIPLEATADSYPTVTAKFGSECGYLSLINQDGRIVQIGNPDEVDKVAYKKNETVIKEPFRATSQPSSWKNNEAILPYPYYLGDKNMPNRQVGSYDWSKTAEGIVPRYQEVPATTRSWGGPAITRDIPANSEGSATGNFTSPVRFWSKQGSPREVIRNEMILQSGTEVLAAAILRDSTGSKQEYIFEMRILNELVGSISLPVKDYPKGFFEMIIVKESDTITFTIAEIESFEGSKVNTRKPIVMPITIEGISKRAVDKVSLWAPKSSNKPVLYSEWTDYKFTWINVDKVADIPNQFQPDDVLTVDFSNGNIWQNGTESWNLGDIGNDFFPLEYGNNQIYIGYSEWTESPPEVTVEYREAWL